MEIGGLAVSADGRASQSFAEARDRTRDLQIFSLTLSQLSHRGLASVVLAVTLRSLVDCRQMQSASSPACLR